MSAHRYLKLTKKKDSSRQSFQQSYQTICYEVLEAASIESLINQSCFSHNYTPSSVRVFFVSSHLVLKSAQIFLDFCQKPGSKLSTLCVLVPDLR